MHAAVQRPAHCRPGATVHRSCLALPGRRAFRLPVNTGITASQNSAPSIRPAQPIEYWPCADLHVRVFHESHRQSQAADSSVGNNSNSSTLAPLWHVLERIDHVSCLDQNDALGRVVGKNALLVACIADGPIITPASPAASPTSTDNTDDSSVAIARIQQQFPLSTEPAHPAASLLEQLTRSVHAEVLRQAASLAHRVVPAAVQPGVGLTAEEGGLIGVASLDAFGDKVPPRQLNPYSTGAFGWYRREGIAYVSNVAVLPAARRQGVARALVAAAEHLSAEWGCRAIGLHCNPKNEAAMSLYRALGYRMTGILEPPWIPYLMGRPPDRCMFMMKRLPVAAGTLITARGRGMANSNLAPASPVVTPTTNATSSVAVSAPVMPTNAASTTPMSGR